MRVRDGQIVASASEIRPLAGVAPSATYTYFESKLDLLYRVYSSRTFGI